MKIILVALSMLILSACQNSKTVSKEEKPEAKYERIGFNLYVTEYKHNENIYLIFKTSDGLFVIKEEVKK